MAWLWLLFAILSPVCYSLGSIIDKFVSLRDVKFYDYARVIGILNLVIGLILILFVKIPFNTYGLLALFSGIVYAILLFLYFHSLQFEEISRVIAIIYTFPVLVAVFAALFLGEFLTPIKYVAIILAVLGGILVSFKHTKKQWNLSKALPFLLLAIVLEAGIEVLDKYLLSSLWFLQISALFCLGIFVGCSPFLLKGFKNVPKEAWLGLISSFLGTVGSFFFIIAASLKEVSIVAATIATQPAITFVLASVIHRFNQKLIEEEFERKNFFLKVIAILMIAIGVTILAF